MEQMTPKEKARLRKQKSRARQATQEGINRLEITLTDRELNALERGRTNRNLGREPYSRNEYIALLLLNDEHVLTAQMNTANACRKCDKQPPAHCEGLFKGAADCWLTYDCLNLNLTVVTGHSESNKGA